MMIILPITEKINANKIEMVEGEVQNENERKKEEDTKYLADLGYDLPRKI